MMVMRRYGRQGVQYAIQGLRYAGRGLRAAALSAQNAATHPQTRAAARRAARGAARAGRFAGTQAWRGTRNLARLGARGVRRGAQSVRAHPRNYSIGAATVASGAAGAFVGYHVPELAASVTQGIANIPYGIADAVTALSRGYDSLTPWGFHALGDGANYVVRPAVQAYQGAKPAVDYGAAALAGGAAAVYGYRLAQRHLPGRPAPPIPLAPPRQIVINIP